MASSQGRYELVMASFETPSGTGLRVGLRSWASKNQY